MHTMCIGVSHPPQKHPLVSPSPLLPANCPSPPFWVVLPIYWFFVNPQVFETLLKFSDQNQATKYFFPDCETQELY